MSDKTKQVIIRNFPYTFLIILSIFLWFLGGALNSYFNGILSPYRIVIQDLKIPFLGVVIAPINEELVKFIGYMAVYVFGKRLINALGYKTKKKFIDDYLLIAFIISAGGFGLFEGIGHNLGWGSLCFIAFISLNAFIHMTFSIYPYILGRKYHNQFLLFLPLGMLLHSVHNFIIDFIWDNKWVTFMMITILFLPIVFFERKNFYLIMERAVFEKIANPGRSNLILSILFISLYVFIFLCVWLRFS